MSTETEATTAAPESLRLSSDDAAKQLEATAAGRLMMDMRHIMQDMGANNSKSGVLTSIYGVLMKSMGLATSAIMVDHLATRLTGHSPINAAKTHVMGAGSKLGELATRLKQQAMDNGVSEESLQTSGFLGNLISAFKSDVGNGTGALKEQAGPVISFLEELADKMGLNKSVLAEIPGVQRVKEALGDALGKSETGKLALQIFLPNKDQPNSRGGRN